MYENANLGTEVQETDIDAAWDELDGAEVVGDEAGTGADQQLEAEETATTQETGEQEEKNAAEDEPAEVDGSDQSFTLKHLDEVKTVSKDEVVALAQKGLDYDRIRQDRDSAKANESRLSGYEEFLKEMAAANGTDVDSLVDSIRATILTDAEKRAGREMDANTALERVRFAKERKEIEAAKLAQQRETEAQTARAEKRQADIQAFAKAYPAIDPTKIPQKVWSDVNGGESLLVAYTRYENEQLKLEIAAEKQNKKNASATTGSRATVGNTEVDEIDKWWNEE